MAEHVVCLCNVLLFLVICVYQLDLAVANHLLHMKPAADFSKHTLIKPKIYHGREKRQISTSREKGVPGDNKHAHNLIVAIELDGVKRIFDLQLNNNLLPKDYFRRYQKNGTHVVDRPNIEKVELCQYQGVIRNVPRSWAALSTCRKGLSGVIYDGNELYYIERASEDDTSVLDDHHFIYKHSDLKESNKTCGYEDEIHHHSEEHEFNRILRLYSSLNIFIALVGVVVWTEHDEIDLSSSGDITLTNFLHYRREKLIKEHPNDNAQLLTKFVFNKGVVGKALKGPICTFEYSGGVSMDHSTVVSLVATTVAHEMGHNFGMEHDSNECHCPEERCIMAPSSSSLWPTHWSSCSLEYLALAFEHGMDYCLRNKPTALFDSPVCGNGFVEPGEQCDCGLSHTCDNTCCNATTCMLYNNASCATGECCDLTTCRPKLAGSLCRAADYECDLPEYCTGQSEYCPADIYKMDTEVCDGGKAFCYQGTCRTRSDQCKLLWGNTGKSSDDQCYNMNTKGTRHGNCGYHRVNQSYIRCEDENVLCGMLHCRHLNERLEFGMESVAILSQSFINLKGSIIPCRTAIVDLGINQVDPGLAPDGAKCGEGKMCVNQKCMAVSSLRANITKCPQDCNGNGVCNSLGHCHCKDGFAPPFCDYPGPGGSEDSGPATDPNARKEFVMAMYIVFLGIIPIISVVTFLMYYMKHNVNFKWQKTNAASKTQAKIRSTTSFTPEPTVRNDDNSSLLQDHHTSNHSGFQNEFFGQFKGFKLFPVNKASTEIKPQRSAPPVPVVIPSASVITKIPNQIIRSNRTQNESPSISRSVTRSNSEKLAPVSNAILNANNISTAPALPPPNPGSNPRPLISSPILETSTCTAKELMSPLRSAPKVPLRPAPDNPSFENKRPLSSPNTITHSTIVASEEPIVKKNTGSTLNRIASFLKSKDDKTKLATNTNSLPRNNVKAHKMDKNALRTIEISGPIPQNEIEISVATLPIEDEKNKTVVMRAQSFRDSNVTIRPNIPNFGSMRQPNFKRPTSIPVANRPKSPPPPRPPLPKTNPLKVMKIPGLPGYQNPTKSVPPESKLEYQYDDCMNEAPLAKINEENSPNSGDNIYAVIEESPKLLENVKSNSGSSESVGLLGEIVSEIQNRNFDSIYSTSTLARKQKEQLKKQQLTNNANDSERQLEIGDGSETYVNTPSIYKSPEYLYSNMGNLKSSASSTSSGYIHPSAVNAPKINPVSVSSSSSNNAKIINAPTKTVFSTFKSDSKMDKNTYKPVSSTVQRSVSSFTNKSDSSPASLKKTENDSDPASKTTKPLSKQTTLPALIRQTTPPSVNKQMSPNVNRQITPPNLRVRKSPTKTVPSSPKNLPKSSKTNSNSPDLVISCSTSNTITSNTKSPDVLNSTAKKTTKLNGLLLKPQPAPKTVSKLVVKTDKKTVTNKSNSDVKPPINVKVITKVNSDLDSNTNKALPPGSRLAAKQTSNVASLQQKFENKPPVVLKNIKK